MNRSCWLAEISHPIWYGNFARRPVIDQRYLIGYHWANLEEMWSAGSLDVEAVLGVLVRYVGGADDRVERLCAFGDRR